MVKRILAGPWEALKERFPDRQIYHRTEGQVRYFVISTTMQVGAVAGACVASMWMAIATVNLIIDEAEERNNDMRVAAMEAGYQEALEEARASEAAAIAYLESQTDAFDRTAVQFQMRHETLRRLMDFAENLEIGGDIESPSVEGGEILMAVTSSDPDPRESLMDVSTPAPSGTAAEARVSAMVAEQDSLLYQAEDSAEARIENLRAVLRLTGLRLDDVLEEGRDDEGTGGPLIPISESQMFGTSLDMDDPFNARVARIASRLIEVDELTRAVDSSPIGFPIGAEDYRKSSDFGDRIDPFTRRPSFHAGLDFTAYRNAPILAAGPGRVVYAGRRSGYGRTVEIDHGYGFKTRYGHLNSIDVRYGDIVEEGQRIGGMGNTGRSTATHLHFEVMFRDRHVDPANFLRAGRYVQ